MTLKIIFALGTLRCCSLCFSSWVFMNQVILYDNVTLDPLFGLCINDSCWKLRNIGILQEDSKLNYMIINMT